MNDPHITKLFYQFISEDPSVLFDKAQPLPLNLGSFEVEIKDGGLVAMTQEHSSDKESARAAFEPFLHAWESTAFLSSGKYRELLTHHPGIYREFLTIL